MAVTDVVATGGAVFGGTGLVTFTPGGGKVDSGLRLLWDFDNDGDFSETVEEITELLYEFEAKTGRDFPSNVIGLAGAGTFRSRLRNDGDEFAFFNTASPLNTGLNSLRTGRKLRLETDDVAELDPALLLRDRFTTDGLLAGTETGQAWATVSSGPGAGTWIVAAGRASPVAADSTNEQYATADVGADDHYVQASIGPLGELTMAGVVARYTDPGDYVMARVTETDGVELVEVVAGTPTVLATYTINPWDRIVVGLRVLGAEATVYVSGAEVLTDTLAASSGGDSAGLVAIWESGEALAPSFTDAWVFENVSGPITGVLWTGDVSSLKTTAPPGGPKVATLDGEGWLARAALPDVAAPRLPTEGAPTGLLVGDVLAKAALLHPPGPVALGTVTTGPVGIPDGKALTLARLFEQAEIGLLHETPEGPVGYLDRTLTGNTPVVTFCDDPGPGLGFELLEPFDQRRAIVNQVTAGVAPSVPDGIVRDADSAGADVDIVLPADLEGQDLVIVVVANSKGVDGDGVDWFVPRFWTEHRNLKTAIGMRIYSRIADGARGVVSPDAGTTVKFFDDAGTIAGLWVADLWRIRDWYGSTSGVFVGQPTSGYDAGGIAHGWAREPTWFLLVATGMVSIAGGALDVPFVAPHGYRQRSGVLISSGAYQYDAAFAAATKIDSTEAEDPGLFRALTGLIIPESVVIAVRGYDGELTKATGAQPGQPAGRFTTFDDHASQLEQRAVRSHPQGVCNLFADEGDAAAYAEAILARAADDRPIFALTFEATLSAAHRAQAVARRVGHVIHLIADGPSGHGVAGDFTIESITHRATNAGKVWKVTWELSRA